MTIFLSHPEEKATQASLKTHQAWLLQGLYQRFTLDPIEPMVVRSEGGQTWSLIHFQFVIVSSIMGNTGIYFPVVFCRLALTLKFCCCLLNLNFSILLI